MPTQITMTLLFLVVAGLIGWSAYNLYNPVYQPPIPAAVSFLATIAVGELALHAIFVQSLVVAFFVLFGGVWGILGALGFLTIAASWGAMALYYFAGYSARDEMEDALCEGLGDSYRDDISALECLDEDISVDALAHPFRLRDPEVEVLKDIPFGQYGQKLDVRRPRGGVSDAPVLLQLHGGAWTEKMGSKNEQALPLMNHLARNGWVCVASSYRLSPTHTLPDHIIDCKEAIAWIKSTITDYGGNPDFIVVTGGSAGGHLCALVSLTANDPDFQPGFEDVDTRVQGAIPFYGPMDFTDEKGFQPNDGLREALETSIIKRSLNGNEDFYRSVSPMHRIHAEAPPFLIVHGDQDTLVPIEEGEHFARSLLDTSANPVAFAAISRGQHAFDILPSLRSEYVKLGVGRFANWCYGRYLTATRATQDTVSEAASEG